MEENKVMPTVDFNKIFTIENDEFEGTKKVYTDYPKANGEIAIWGVACHIEENNSYHFFITSLEINAITSATHGFRFNENEYEATNVQMIKKFFNASSYRGILINIDNNETIRLRYDNSDNGPIKTRYSFPISHEDFLKCCTATHLTFEVFRDFNEDDSYKELKEFAKCDTGCEKILKAIDAIKDHRVYKCDEKLVIASFQALYNYAVDHSMFPDAPVVLEKWVKSKRKKEDNNSKQPKQGKAPSNAKAPAKANANEESTGGCYIATAVYGSYDCPQVWTLRRYRDFTLAKTWYGRSFVRTYYTISPTLVKWFGNTKFFQSIGRIILDRKVDKLNANGIENTRYQDREW